MENSNFKVIYVKKEKCNVENLTKKCRGCLMEEDEMNYLFDEQGQQDEKGFCSLADILLRTTGTEVKLEEGLPSHLCQQCTDAILDFYNFKTIFIETEDRLQKIRLASSKASNVPEIFDIRVHPDIVFNVVKNKPRVEPLPLDGNKEERNKRKQNQSRKGKLKKGDTEIRSFVCEICGQSYKKRETLIGHLETHTEERKYVCQYCNKAVKLKTSFIKHLKLHTNPRQIVCDVCGQRFNLRAHLDIHYKAKHLRIRDFQCTLCDKAFSMKATLEQHIERHNPNRERKFSCNFCHMTYMEKRHLVRHHREKHDEVKFDCQFCERSYIQEIDLKKHLKKCHPSPEQQLNANNESCKNDRKNTNDKKILPVN